MAGNLKPTEQERWYSFSDFPVYVPISERILAKAGFVYSGQGDEVQCPFCNFRHKGWRKNDNPMEIHRRGSPACVFLSDQSDAHTCLGLGRNNITEQQSSIHRSFEPVSFTPESPNRGSKASTSMVSNSHDELRLNNPNLIKDEDDIYSAPGDAMQCNQFNSIRENNSFSSINSNSRRQTPDERTYQKSEFGNHPNDHRNPQSVSNGIRNNQNTDFRGHNSNPSIPPVSNTTGNPHNYYRGHNFTNSSVPPTSSNPIINTHTNLYSPTVTAPRQNSSEPPQSLVSQRPVLIEDPTPPPQQRNPYNMSEVSNSLPQTTPQVNTLQQHVVRSNDEAMEVLDEQISQGSDWFARRERTNQSLPTRLDYSQYQVRLDSFHGMWSTDCPVQPVDLAQAGLYYTGPSDRVQCYYCRGGLYGWEPGDTAFGEHSRHFPQCVFVIRKNRAMLEGHPFMAPSNPHQGPTEDVVRTNLPRVQHEMPHQQQLPQDQSFYAPIPQVQQVTPNQPQQHTMQTQPNPWRDTGPNQQHNQNQLQTGLQSQQYQQHQQSQMHVQSTNNQNAQSVIDIIINMGYDREIVERALQRLNRDTPVNTSNVLDMVYVLEEAEENGDPTGMLHDQMDHVLDSNNTRVSPDNLTTNQIRSLKEENERLREATMCKICLQKEVDTLLIPCRHLVSCESCAQKITQCPTCGSQVTRIMKTYLP